VTAKLDRFGRRFWGPHPSPEDLPERGVEAGDIARVDGRVYVALRDSNGERDPRAIVLERLGRAPLWAPLGAA
jgi:hypothetical protein